MGAAPGAEVLAALLLLCWLCCWPDDNSSDTSSSRKHPRKPVAVESGSHRRSGDFFSRRFASSAVSLHLPSTSGHSKEPLSAHRSHEEIRSRRKSHHESDEDTRYFSAPSVIDEVLHRRDWERSTKDLYIPLNPQNECNVSIKTISSTPDAPCAEPESSSIECLKPDDSLRKCKKHHTNIKSSKGKKCKESNKDDIKDTDATEAVVSNFYIGDNNNVETVAKIDKSNEFIGVEKVCEERSRSIYKAKDAKQSFNESVKQKEVPEAVVSISSEEEGRRAYKFRLVEGIDGADRSGAEHHSIESRLSFSMPYPPPSVEVAGYEESACYLRERAAGVWGGGAGAGAGRHASDGDILAPALRPESGAFSESDLELELELQLEEEERPPAYDELHFERDPQPCGHSKKETAI